jgi:hypothetical protein
MNPSVRNYILAALTGSIACTQLSGCGARPIDLAAIQEYAKTTAAASTSFDSIADDYYQTCLRRREYAEPATAGGQALSKTLPSRPEPPVARSPGATPQAANIGGDASCQESSSLAYRWQQENDVVVGYVRAIGDVAGVDTAPQNFGDLASSLKSAGAIDSDATATAAGNLATALVSALISARQRAAVRQIVQSAHDNGLSTLISGLQFTASQYKGQLDREHDAVASYYDTVLGGEEREFAVLECPEIESPGLRSELDCAQYVERDSGARYHKITRSVIVLREARAAQLRDLIRQQRLQRLASFNSISSNVKAEQAYVGAIGAIGAGNDALLEAPPNDLQAIVSSVKPYVDLLQDKVAAMIAALRK